MAGRKSAFVYGFETLAEVAKREKVTKTALIVVGKILDGDYERSLLYHPEFTTEFRKGVGKDE